MAVFRMRLLQFAASCLVVTALPAQTTATAQRPNVVLIITDDVGYGDLGVYGAPDIRTPNIDALARAGVRLTDFYANGATCTPTRAGLISGRYQQRYALEFPLGTFGGEDFERGLPVSGHSIPQLLRNSGYTTALVGKWHLGWRPEFSPIAHGFDYFFGFKAGYIDYYQHTYGPNGNRDDLWENDTIVRVPGYMTDLVTQRSVRFIDDNARRPFFLEVAYNAAHWPYQRPDQPSVARDRGRHLSAFDDSTNTRADYVAMLERADRGVGEIVAALGRHGVLQNTIVIFTNDNGGEWLSRNTPLFHHKGTVWEGGIRVPAIVRWSGKIPPGTVSSQVGITMDLTRSILAATGAAIPRDAKLEGMDLLPILQRRAPVVERTLFWRVSGPRPQQAVRSGNWKLMLDGSRAFLFDLRADAGERNNLIGRRSDVAKRLRKDLAAWMSDVDAEAKQRAEAMTVAQRIGSDVDHIIVGIDTLERGMRLLADLTGVTPVKGGVHPGRGTQNALMSLGSGVYLELIAPNFADTAAKASVAFFSQFTRLTPYGWAVHAKNADSVSTLAAKRGLAPGVVQQGSRARPDGKTLAWRTVVPWPQPYGAYLPFFIEWSASSPHPSTESPMGCTLAAVRMLSPAPDSLRMVINRAEVRVPVIRDEREGLQFDLDCPAGRVEFR